MKVLRKLIIGIMLLCIVLGTALLVWLYTGQPSYQGVKNLSVLDDSVKVSFDEYGVPYIEAKNAQDAYRALGYLHAQERLFQMEMLRRVTQGRLSEVIGPEMLANDKMFRTLGINEMAKKSAQKFLVGNEKDQFAILAQAYQEGINNFIENGPTPVEFTIIGIEKEHFELSDIYGVMGYMSLGFAEGFKVDPLITYIKSNWGEEYLEVFNLQSDPSTPFIPSYDTAVFKVSDEISEMAASIQWPMSVPPFIGSNAWVISKERSKSGFPILANDPHIGFSQPAVWFEASLSYPGNDIYGYYIAGFPFAVHGHNKNVAWGITMLENDDLDFYIERENPDDSLQYLSTDEWYEIDSRWDTIKVKDSEDRIIPIRVSKHGPIINGAMVLAPSLKSPPVAAHWEFLNRESELVEAAFNMTQSQDVDDIQAAAAMVNAPGLNLMAASKSGNIAWFAAAHLWDRPEKVNSFMFLNGTGKHDIKGYLPVDRNPHSINPPNGYVYSANNQPDSVDGYLYPGYYMPRDRAERIIHLLGDRKELGIKDMQEIQLDVYSAKVVEAKEMILAVLSQVELDSSERVVVDLLKNWDGNQDKDLAGPAVFYNLLSHTLYLAIMDEIGEKRADQFLRTSIIKRSLIKFLKAEDSPWWDNQSTADVVETRLDILRYAMRQAGISLVEQLGEDPKKWKWGKIHTLTHGHPLGQVDLLSGIFNVGPFQVSGGRETINNLAFNFNMDGLFPVHAGPSTRKIIDMAHPDSAWSILPTGQSGHFLSNHYSDQANLYNDGKWRTVKLGKLSISKENERKLLLLPHE